jgi:hypothetical protein
VDSDHLVEGFSDIRLVKAGDIMGLEKWRPVSPDRKVAAGRHR